MNEISSSLAKTFSLTRGGPFYQLQLRLGRREGERERVVFRAVLTTLVTWLPLLIFSLVQGLAFGPQVKVPFLRDFAVNTRFLVALPILILAESRIDQMWRFLVQEFLRSGLVKETELSTFDEVIEKITSLRDRILPEVVMIVFAYLPNIFSVQLEFLSGISNWHFIGTSAEASLADWWFNFIGAPLFRFFLLRWAWRMSLWTLLLWHMSRIKLHLVATHTDMAAGLGFLSEGQKVFSSIVFAGGAVIAGQIGNAIAYEGDTLSTVKYHMIIYAVLAIVLLVVPLLAVTPVLQKIKRKALFEFGALVTKHDQLFDAKWIQGDHPADEVILGNPDASSLADLGGSFNVVREMRIVPIDGNTLLKLGIAAALPMLPVVLFATPANEIIRVVLAMIGL